MKRIAAVKIRRPKSMSVRVWVAGLRDGLHSDMAIDDGTRIEELDGHWIAVAHLPDGRTVRARGITRERAIAALRAEQARHVQ